MFCTCRALALAVAGLVATACASRQVEVETGTIDLSARWGATLVPATAAVRDSANRPFGEATVGRASMMPGSSLSQTSAVVSIYNAQPGAVHPWHVHLGRCGDDRGILGGPAAYTPISVAPDGKGDAAVTLPFTTPTSGEYFVNVHRSPSDLTPISCGNLAIGG